MGDSFSLIALTRNDTSPNQHRGLLRIPFHHDLVHVLAPFARHVLCLLHHVAFLMPHFSLVHCSKARSITHTFSFNTRKNYFLINTKTISQYKSKEFKRIKQSARDSMGNNSYYPHSLLSSNHHPGIATAGSN